jgi:predicted ATPase/DNA-binding CsgD family transcriptional regulator
MNSGHLSSDELIADELTWREQEVLLLLADRLTNREIADQLHLAESTVKDYVGNIISKLYVKNRRQAVERAAALGLLDDGQKFHRLPKPNLPAEPTPFVGRNVELAEIKMLLGETRLLTLTGPGGIGKSRLALRVAMDLGNAYEDHVYYVPLAAIKSADNIIQTIAENLGFPMATQEDPQIQLLRYLRNKQLLLVLDNFEHLMGGVNIVSEIIQSSPGVKILVTSREKLNLLSETTLVISGITLPEQPIPDDLAEFDAVTLFVQSANKACPGFIPSTDEINSIVKISSIVQGMPLAIELAAAWMQIIPVAEILKELEKGPDILVTEAFDSPKRHRSMRNVFDHSWFLLSQFDKEIFIRLSVFRGGFTRQAAQQVSMASLQDLMGLVSKSLLSRDPNSGRLEIHELLRQYAQEQLEVNQEANQLTLEAHAAYYAEFMKERWLQLKDDRQLVALSEIETDIENVRAAWSFYIQDQNSKQLLKFVYGLWYIHWIRGWNLAGMQLFAQGSQVQKDMETKQDVIFRALCMAFQGYFMTWLDLSEQGYQLTRSAVDILKGLNDTEALVFAIDGLLINCYFQNRTAEQIEVSQDMYELAVGIGDSWLLAFTMFAMGMAALIAEGFQEARRVAQSELILCEEIGDKIGSTLPLIVLGHVDLALKEYQQARGYYQRCKRISQSIGFLYSFQTSSKYLGKVDISLNNLAEAEKNLRQCLAGTVEMGFVRDFINLIYEFSRLRVAQGDLEGAVGLLAFVRQHPVSSQSRLLEGRIRDSVEELLAELEPEMDSEIFQAAEGRGEKLEFEAIVADLVG